MVPFLFILLFLFIIGLAIGSFLNVVIYRSVHKDSALRGRSYCDSCKQPLSWYDNVPLLSFLFLSRRCRYCKEPISWQYPIVEFLTGALFVWWYVMGSTFFQLTSQPFAYIQPLFWLCVALLFVVIFFVDLSYFIIPDSAMILLVSLTLGYRILLTLQGVMQQADFWFSLLSGLGIFLFFLFLFVLTRGKGIGFGDVKLSFPLAILLGFPTNLVGFFLAFLIGAVIGSVLLLFGKKKLKSRVPFGPFLIIGTVVALLWGERIVEWYLRYILL